MHLLDHDDQGQVVVPLRLAGNPILSTANRLGWHIAHFGAFASAAALLGCRLHRLTARRCHGEACPGFPTWNWASCQRSESCVKQRLPDPRRPATGHAALVWIRSLPRTAERCRAPARRRDVHGRVATIDAVNLRIPGRRRGVVGTRQAICSASRFRSQSDRFNACRIQGKRCP